MLVADPGNRLSVRRQTRSFGLAWTLFYLFFFRFRLLLFVATLLVCLSMCPLLLLIGVDAMYRRTSNDLNNGGVIQRLG